MRSFTVVEQGVTITRTGGELNVERANAVIRRTRIEGLESVMLFGGVEVTSGTIRSCLANGVDVSFFTKAGRYRGRLCGPASKNGQRRLAQYSRVLDEKFRLKRAKEMVSGKVANQRNILLRGQRKKRCSEIAQALREMRSIMQKIPRVGSHNELMGNEGRAAALYFGTFGRLVMNNDFEFSKRTRRPPRDPLNACLSFGYMILMARMDGFVQAAGLDPMLGFLHEPDYGRPSLALDLIEEFRPVVVDSLVLRLVNRKQLSRNDFKSMEPDMTDEILAGGSGDGSSEGESSNNGKPGVLLNERGRRIFLSGIMKRLRESLYYPPRECSFPLSDILDMQVQHLVRVMEGREKRYIPFVPR